MAASDARPFPLKNTAYRVTFPLMDADGDLVTGAAGLDSEVSKDGGTFADCTNEATEIATSSGVYFLDLTATEMNADTVAIIIKTSTSGAKTTPIVLYPVENTDIPVNVKAISDDETAADNLEAACDGGSYNVGGGSVVAASVTGNVGGSVGSLAAQAKADVNAEVDSALNTAIPGSPTADSINERVATMDGRILGTLAAGTHNAQSGDAYARLGAPAGASVSADMAAVKSDTAAILVDTGTTLDGKLNTIDDFLDTEIAAILADTNELQTDLANGGRLDLLIDAIKAKTDNLPADPAATGDAMTLTSAAIDGIIDEAVEGSLTLRQAIRLLLSVLVNESGGGGTATITFRDLADTKTRISATVDSSGNRTAVTTDAT